MNPHVENYFLERASLLGEVLFYHLTLEALLTELIKRTPESPEGSKLNGMMFAKKAALCAELGKLTPELHHALSKLNKVRNRYAHELGYEVSFEEALSVAETCGKAGVEFTDSVDSCSVAEAKELGYDTLSVLNAAFRNTFFEVVFQQDDGECFDFIS
jgi:hypothetical protein